MHQKGLTASLLSVVLATPVIAQGCHNLDAVTAVGQDLLQRSPFSGSSCISIEQGGTTVYAQCFGTLGSTDVLPIASATKTLSAAVLLSLVDDGTLTLDDPVGQYLPEWNQGQRAQITLRMCFAHTSGLPANDAAISDQSLTLRQAAAQLNKEHQAQGYVLIASHLPVTVFCLRGVVFFSRTVRFSCKTVSPCPTTRALTDFA